MKLFKNKKNIVLVSLVGLSLTSLNNVQTTEALRSFDSFQGNSTSYVGGSSFNNNSVSNFNFNNNVTNSIKNDANVNNNVNNNNNNTSNFNLSLLDSIDVDNLGNQGQQQSQQETQINNNIQNLGSKLNTVNNNVKDVKDRVEETKKEIKDTKKEIKSADKNAVKSKKEKEKNKKDDKNKKNNKDKAKLSKEAVKSLNELLSGAKTPVEAANFVGEITTKLYELRNEIKDTEKDDADSLWGDDGKINEILSPASDDDSDNSDVKPYVEKLLKRYDEIGNNEDLDDAQKIEAATKLSDSLIKDLKTYITSGEFKLLNKKAFKKTIGNYSKLVNKLEELGKSDESSDELDNVVESLKEFKVDEKELKAYDEKQKKTNKKNVKTGKDKNGKTNKNKGIKPAGTGVKDNKKVKTGNITKPGSSVSLVKKSPIGSDKANDNNDNAEVKDPTKVDSNKTSEENFFEIADNAREVVVDTAKIEERQALDFTMYKVLGRLNQTNAELVLKEINKGLAEILREGDKKNLGGVEANIQNLASRVADIVSYNDMGVQEVAARTDFLVQLNNIATQGETDKDGKKSTGIKAKYMFFKRMEEELKTYYLPYIKSKFGKSLNQILTEENKNKVLLVTDQRKAKFLATFCAFVFEDDKEAEYEKMIVLNKSLFDELLLNVSQFMNNEMKTALNRPGAYAFSEIGMLSHFVQRIGAGDFNDKDLELARSFIKDRIAASDKIKKIVLDEANKKLKTVLNNIFNKYDSVKFSKIGGAINQTLANKRAAAFGAVMGLLEEFNFNYEKLKRRFAYVSDSYKVALNFVFARVLPKEMKLKFGSDLASGTPDPYASGYATDYASDYLEKVQNLINEPFIKLKQSIQNSTASAYDNYANEGDVASSMTDYVLRLPSTQELLKTFFPAILFLNRFMKLMTTRTSEIKQLRESPEFKNLLSDPSNTMSQFLDVCEKRYDDSRLSNNTFEDLASLSPDVYINNYVATGDSVKKVNPELFVFDLIYANMIYSLMIFREFIIPPSLACGAEAQKYTWKGVQTIFQNKARTWDDYANVDVANPDNGAVNGPNDVLVEPRARSKFINSKNKTVVGVNSFDWADSILNSYVQCAGEIKKEDSTIEEKITNIGKSYNNSDRPYVNVAGDGDLDAMVTSGLVYGNFTGDTRANFSKFFLMALNTFYRGGLARIFKQVHDKASSGAFAEAKKRNVLFSKENECAETVVSLALVANENTTDVIAGAKGVLNGRYAAAIASSIPGSTKDVGSRNLADGQNLAGQGNLNSVFGIKIYKNANGQFAKTVAPSFITGDIAADLENGAVSKTYVYSDTGTGGAVGSANNLPVICQQNLFKDPAKMFIAFSMLLGSNDNHKATKTGGVGTIIDRSLLKWKKGDTYPAKQTVASLSQGTFVNEFDIDRLGDTGVGSGNQNVCNSYGALLKMFDKDLGEILYKGCAGEATNNPVFSDYGAFDYNRGLEGTDQSLGTAGASTYKVNYKNIFSFINQAIDIGNVNTTLYKYMRNGAFNVNNNDVATFRKEDGLGEIGVENVVSGLSMTNEKGEVLTGPAAFAEFAKKMGFDVTKRF